MKDLSTVSHFPPLQKLVNILVKKTQNDNPLFFKVMVAYYFAKIASIMRTNIETHDRGIIPVNMFAINLAPTGCVDQDTEYLTPFGWKTISNFSPNDKIMEISPTTLNGTFVKPLNYVKQLATETAYKCVPDKRTKLSMHLSPEHTILYTSDKGNNISGKAKDLLNRTTSLSIPSNFNLITNSRVNLTNNQIRLQLAFSADGSFRFKYKLRARVRVKKLRKINRMRQLLIATGIEFKEKLEGNSISFWFNPPMMTKSLNWVWQCSRNQLAVITNESIHWDGSIDKRTGNYRFYTTIKEHADVMQYAYQSTFDTVVSINTNNRKGRVHKVNGRSYITKSIDYTVSQSSTKQKYVMPDKVIKQPMPNNMEYCFTTNTGFWLARKDDFIFVTGNSGKGYSTCIVEERVINKFKEHFVEYTFPSVSEKNLNNLAAKRATRNGTDPNDEYVSVKKEFDGLGEPVFSFDSGTSPAVKQMRHTLLMANIGAVNLEIDEVGSNLIANTEVLNTFLELFDVGKTKIKLTKNTTDNKRNKQIDGKTPTNMMLFGTPAKLLAPGSKVEDEFFTFLEIGFARRCFFGFSKQVRNNLNITPQELYDLNTDPSMDTFINDLSIKIGRLADEINYNLILKMDKKVALLINEYQINCNKIAATLPEYEDLKKAELEHRYYKMFKLAGAFAFIDGSIDITEDHIYYSIKFTEECGEAFNKILHREKAHKTLAKYIVSYNGELTQVDLMDKLPFFKGTEVNRKDLLTRAMTYGYKNNMIIKKSYIDGIEFFTGETLETTDLQKLIVSYSQEYTSNYFSAKAPFEKLHKLVLQTGLHYTAHHFNDGYRCANNMIPGFNLVILDVDGGTTLEAAKMLLRDYQVIMATTKRHTPTENRFRVILPISHVVKLDVENYSKFMSNVFKWLPFTVDEVTADCARKWESFAGNYYSHDGKLLDALRFIPNTNAEEKQSKQIQENADLSNLERWFLLHINLGNRNNQLIRYALALIDSGKDVETIRIILQEFNKKLKFPVTADEINATVMQTVAKRAITQSVSTIPQQTAAII